MLVQAAHQQWNIRIAERYRHGRGVVKYLARYVRGGPIKDHRLVSFDGRQVTVDGALRQSARARRGR